MNRLFKTGFIGSVLLMGTFATALAQSDEAALRTRAERLHKKIFSIDTHNDTPIYINHPDSNYGVTKGQVSFPMMKEGGLDAALFAIYQGQGPRDTVSSEKAKRYAINEINMFKEYVAKQNGEAVIAYCVDDFLKYKKQEKSIVMFMIENGYAISKDIANVEMFYDMGVRTMTLCHNSNNDICDSSQDKPEHGGLSEFGIKVVREMNRLGMVVDVSHASTSTLYDCIKISEAPIIASHSGVWAIKNHPRNLRDDEMIAIAEKGGLVQIATGRFFLSTLPKPEVTVSHIVDHIDYAVNLIGIEHVGLGTDFDGGGGVVGLENVSKMKEVTIEMMRRGYSDEDISLFWGGNVLRVLREIEKIAGK